MQGIEKRLLETYLQLWRAEASPRFTPLVPVAPSSVHKWYSSADYYGVREGTCSVRFTSFYSLWFTYWKKI